MGPRIASGALALLAVAASAAAAEGVVLRNGDLFPGTVVSRSPDLVVVDHPALGRVDLPAALVQSRASLPDERDRALAADIIIGTLRWQRSLDHLVAHFANRAVEHLYRPRSDVRAPFDRVHPATHGLREAAGAGHPV